MEQKINKLDAFEHNILVQAISSILIITYGKILSHIKKRTTV